MKERIPLVALSTTALTAACTDPIVGDWELTDVGGYLAQYLEEYGGSINGELRIDEDLDAEFEFELCYSYYGYRYCYGEEYEDGEVEDDGDGEYTIEFKRDDFKLACELDDGTLECDLGDGGTLEFEKD